MNVYMTFKLSAENRRELIDTFGGEVRVFQAHVKALQAAGVLPGGPVRWLLIGGRCEDAFPSAVSGPVSPEQEETPPRPADAPLPEPPRPDSSSSS